MYVSSYSKATLSYDDASSNSASDGKAANLHQGAVGVGTTLKMRAGTSGFTWPTGDVITQIQVKS